MMRIMQVCKVHMLSIAALALVLVIFSCLIFTVDAEAYSETDVVYSEGITGGAVYFDKSTGTITDCDESVTAAVIPDSIEDVVITSIGADAFTGCQNLRTVRISAGIKEIAVPAFKDCNSLEQIEVDESSSSFVVDSGALYDINRETLYKFPSQSEYGGFTVPEYVKYVAPYAFENASNLNNINLNGTSETTMKLGEGCFFGCVNLEYFVFPQYRNNDVGTFIFGDYAFRGCEFLQNIYFPDGVTDISKGMFMDCLELKSVWIGQNIKSVADDAFVNCLSLQSLDVEYGNKYFSYGSVAALMDIDETRILRYPPANRDEEYTSIPSTVTHICNNAFADAVKLKTLLIPDSVQSFGDNVFTGCSEELVIRASSGSAAEKYAIQNGIKYEQINTSRPDKLSQSINVKSKFSCTNGCAPFNLNATARTSLSYSSSNSDVADVDSNGTVTVKSGGNAVITIKAEGTEEYYAAESKVTVYVEKAERTIPIGYSSCKKVFVTGGTWSVELPSFSDYTFKSSNCSIIRPRVSSNGKYEVIEMVNPGKATITVTAKETPQYKAATKKIYVYTYLKTPQIKLRRYSKGKIRISWNAVPGAQKYQVYLYDYAKKKYVLRLTKNSNVKSVLHRGLKNGKTYWYKVRAYRIVDGKRVYSSFSAAKKAVARR